MPQVRPRQDARAKVNLETIALRYNRGHNGRLLSGLIGSLLGVSRARDLLVRLTCSHDRGKDSSGFLFETVPQAGGPAAELC
jgi:hypothetical protein